MNFMNEEEDNFLEQLMSDDKTLDHWIEQTLETPSDSSSHDEQQHAVFVKKRKYEWKNGSTQRTVKAPKLKECFRAPLAIHFPRILKSDIRRKLVSMYENVMNSYDYELISSYFQRFFVTDVRFEKKNITTSPVKSVTILEGVQPVLSFFLLLLQICPDKITRVSDIQLKRLSNDGARTEVACRFVTKNTAIYQLTPQLFTMMKNEMSTICDQDKSFDHHQIASNPQRKLESVNEIGERHQSLFDPISGIFMKSRFQLLETPMEYEVEGHLSFIVNHEKRIERIIVTATGKKNSVKFP